MTTLFWCWLGFMVLLSLGLIWVKHRQRQIRRQLAEADERLRQHLVELHELVRPKFPVPLPPAPPPTRPLWQPRAEEPNASTTGLADMAATVWPSLASYEPPGVAVDAPAADVAPTDAGAASGNGFDTAFDGGQSGGGGADGSY